MMAGGPHRIGKRSIRDTIRERIEGRSHHTL
jgi:hypothetical protein